MDSLELLLLALARKGGSGSGDTDKQDKYHAISQTISTNGWQENLLTNTFEAPVVNRDITDHMTETALCWFECSDTAGEYNCAQGNGSFTISTPTQPTDDITVKVAWFV